MTGVALRSSLLLRKSFFFAALCPLSLQKSPLSLPDAARAAFWTLAICSALSEEKKPLFHNIVNQASVNLLHVIYNVQYLLHTQTCLTANTKTCMQLLRKPAFVRDDAFFQQLVVIVTANGQPVTQFAIIKCVSHFKDLSPGEGETLRSFLLIFKVGPDVERVSSSRSQNVLIY